MNLKELPDMSAAYKQVQEKKKDYDGDGKVESGSKEHAGVVHNAIQKKKGLKPDGKDTRKEEVEVEEGYKPLPKEKMARQANNAYGKEQRAAKAGDEKETNKQMQRRIAIKDPSGRKAALKKEAFAFSEEDLALFEEHGAEIDALTDEQLIDVMEEFILEMAQDDQDLIEICEELESVEMLSEVTSPAAVNSARLKASSQKAPEKGPSRMDRLKGAAKKAGARVGAAAKSAGSAVKKGVKAAGKSVADNAGKAVGTFQGSREAARIKAKRASMQKTPAKSKSSDDDGTGGKLDGVLKSIRKSKGTSSSSSSDSGSSSSGGGESSSSSSSSSAPAKKKPGLLRRIGGAIKRGLKKAVGKTSRLVSKGSDKLAKRLGENYDQIAHLYESGLFSIQEIEDVIEEGYKPIDKKKETAMYRRAGNLSRDALSKGLSTKKGSKAQDKSGKIVSAISSQKEKERFSKMADIKARSNYGG